MSQRLIALLGFVFFFNLFFFHSFGSVMFGLMVFGSFIFLTVTFKPAQYKKTELLSALSILLILLFFCLGVILRANGFIQSVLGLSSLITLVIYAYILSSRIPMVRSLFEFILAPLYFAQTYIKTGFKTISIVTSGQYKEILSEKSAVVKSSLARSLLIGFMIGLIVISILISMFSSADPIFASFIKNIVSADFIQTLSQRLTLSFLLLLLLLPFLTLNRRNIFNSPLELLKRLNLVHEMSVVMGLVALIIGLFLIIQWPYVFVRVPFETDLSKFGVATYSEYVQKGFGELLKIALFVYGLIWAGLVILRENKAKEKSVLKYIQIVVLVEFAVFLFSIFRRIWLYQEYHGWSLIRIYGSFFLLWILGVTIFLALRHFWQRKWVIGEMIFTALIIFMIGVLNVETFIVLNHPPTVNGKVDYVYLSRMSSDGYVGWEKAYTYQKNLIEKYEKKELLNKDERKEVAYAGIVIRELLQNYKDMVLQRGTQNDLKQYLIETYAFQRDANLNLYVPPGSRNYIMEQNDGITKMQELIWSEMIDYRKAIKDITISKSTYKYRFNLSDTDSMRWNRSFFTLPYYSDYFKNKIKTDKKIKDSNIDRFYTWNASDARAFYLMNKNISYHELLQLQRKYFNIYYTIENQFVDQRDYDMDISLESPLLD